MGDEADEHPRILKIIRNWLAGLTAVLLALVGLKAAYHQLVEPAVSNNNATANAAPAPNSSPSAPPVANTTAETSPPANEAAPVPAQLPLRYTKPHGVLEWRHDHWVETDTEHGLAIPFKQVSRKDGMTVIYDQSRDLYLRWPNEGGTVEWSKSNPMVWTELYIVAPDDGSAQ